MGQTMQSIHHEDEQSDTLVQMKIILIKIHIHKHGANCKIGIMRLTFSVTALIKCKRKYLNWYSFVNKMFLLSTGGLKLLNYYCVNG